jgi:predicted GNAT family N-acyltransferase
MVKKMIEYRQLKSDKEIDDAIAIATEVFGVEEISKKLQWRKYPGFEKDDVVGAFEGSKIIGLIRICPQVISIAGVDYKSAGITSVCVLSEFRGGNLSVGLMNYTHQLCKTRGFRLTHLIARKAVDHYYTKFGYVGLSNYPKIRIKEVSGSTDNSKLEFKKVTTFKQEFNQFYNNISHYLGSYFKRDESLFQYSFDRHVELGFMFKEIYFKTKCVGYFVHKGNCIYEVSFSHIDYGTNILSSLFEEFGDFTIETSIQHPLFKNIHELTIDYTYSIRSCLYGGHMVKSLDNEKWLDEKNNELKNINFPFQIPLLDQM